MSNCKLTLIEGERDSEFWAHMGPFFASREVAKELGESLYDREDLSWVLATRRNKIVGWASFHIRKDGIGVSDWSYVVPECRQEGIWGQMHEKRLETFRERGVTRLRMATRDEDMKKVFKRSGLQVRREKGAWVFYEGDVQ